MKVSVEIITGTFIDAEVSENATVNELKEKIATEVKLSVKRLILLVGNDEERRTMTDDEDEMKLIDLGLREDSIVYLFFKHPDLVYKEERSQGRGDHASMEDISSESKSGNGHEEEEEEEAKAKTDGEKEDKAMKNEEENRDVKVEDREDDKAIGRETKDEDDVDDGIEKAIEGEEGESIMDRVS